MFENMNNEEYAKLTSQERAEHLMRAFADSVGTYCPDTHEGGPEDEECISCAFDGFAQKHESDCEYERAVAWKTRDHLHTLSVRGELPVVEDTRESMGWINVKKCDESRCLSKADADMINSVSHIACYLFMQEQPEELKWRRDCDAWNAANIKVKVWGCCPVHNVDNDPEWTLDDALDWNMHTAHRVKSLRVEVNQEFGATTFTADSGMGKALETARAMRDQLHEHGTPEQKRRAAKVLRY